MFYGQTTGMPYYYRIYPGSLNDKSQLEYIVDDSAIADIKRVMLCMDRGLYTEENLKYLVNKGVKFLMALPEVKFVKKLMIENRDELLYDCKNLLSDKTITGKQIETTELGFRMNVHLYYDPRKMITDRAAFIQKLEKIETEATELKELPNPNTNIAKYLNVKQDEKTGKISYTRNEDAIRKELGICGMFAIGETVFKLTSDECLNTYRRRDTIEKAFDDMKNSEGMGRTYCHSKESLEGKAFCAFLGLIIKSYMVTRLRDYMLEKNFTFQKILIELNKIKVVYSAATPNHHCRLLNALTKTQKEILENLELGASIMAEFDWD